MIVRPSAQVLACAGCRQALGRASLSFAASRFAAPISSRLPQVPVALPSKRHLSATLAKRINDGERHDGLEGTEIPEIPENDDKVVDDDSTTPWFLDVEPPRHPPSQHMQELPKVPADAPSVLEPMIKYVFEDMGLDDLALMDLRELDPPAALGPNLIMLFGTARSERHLHISAGRFVRWLRKSHGIHGRADGLIGPGELRTKLRRLRKKAKIMGTNTSIVPRGDNGISTGWICVNFNAGSGSTDTSANFDESGRLSGFGGADMGTTIVVQCMTEERRNELDLETLWQGILKRSIVEGKQLRGEAPETEADVERTLSNKVQLPHSSSALQWQALQQASQKQQQRHFSTSARRLDSATTAARGTVQSKVASNQQSIPVDGADLDNVDELISKLILCGTSIDDSMMQKLLSSIFLATSLDQETADLRLSLADRLLRTAEERGNPVWTHEILVCLIEAMVASPAYGDRLRIAQKNLEFLLIELEKPPSNDQQLRLMMAYGKRRDWDRFWDVFRTPPRFQMPRSAAHYELAYRAMAATRDPKLCTDALRWVWPEMLQEQPRVLPVGQVYRSLKACIYVADAAAEDLLHNPPQTDTLDLIDKRKLHNREFVNLLKAVEDLHRHNVGIQAQAARDESLDRLAGP